MLALLSLAIVGVATWKQGGLEFWAKNALRVTEAALGLHLAVFASALALKYARSELVKPLGATIARFSPESVQTVALAYVFAITVIALFRIEPENEYFNPLVSVFLSPLPGGFPTSLQITVAALFGSLAMMVGACLLIAERRLERRASVALSRLQTLALPLTAVAAVVLCFDSSLSADALHYMTNIGPALHLMNGGTLMVDTFSQYGPGPILITYLAFQLGQPSFAVANIAVQFCNILFYILFIVALWHSTRHKLPALWLGLIVLTFWLSAWAYSGGWSYADGNVNVAPSVLGMRYLPPDIPRLVSCCGLERGSNRRSARPALGIPLADRFA